MTLIADFDALIEPYHDALGEIINGDASSYKKPYSERDDVTLGNPFGPLRPRSYRGGAEAGARRLQVFGRRTRRVRDGRKACNA
jgi:hypothetical protein